jgi:hypothetical protein
VPTRRPQPSPELSSDHNLSTGLRAAVRLFEELESSETLTRFTEGLAPLIAEQLGVALSAPAVSAALLQSPGLVALEAFGGDWIGRWGDLPVEQRWEPVVAAPRELKVSGFVLQRVQYAWVGDGFGYNYEVTRAGSRALLGAVFHLEPTPSEVVAYLTPHVGIAVAPSKVVWLTPEHVFFERVDPAGGRYNISQYTWTGAPKEAELGWIYETCYHRPGVGSPPRD